MTMWDFLESLRNKPEHVRQRIALLSTSAVFVLVATVWWNVHEFPSSERSLSLSEVASPIGVVSNMLAGAASETRDFVSELQQEVAQAASTTTPAEEASLDVTDDGTISAEETAVSYRDFDSIDAIDVNDPSPEPSAQPEQSSSNPSL